MSYLSLLRNNPEYTKLWLAGLISYTGDWFNTIVLLGLVTEYSGGSGIAISIFLAFRILPQLVFAPPSGVLLDIFNRKHILMASNLLRAIVVPFFLFAQGPEHLWIIYTVTIVQFILSAPFEPGQTAIIPTLVSSDEIVEANTLLTITWSIMLALGAVIGGAFAYYFGTAAALLADAITFLIAGLLIAWIRYDHGKSKQNVYSLETGLLHEEDTSFMEGIRYIWKTPQVALILFVKFGQSLGNIDMILAIFATQLFVIGARGEISQAILWSAVGLGAIVGPLLTNLINDGSLPRMQRLVGVGFLLLLIRWVILGWADSLWVVGIACFVGSMGGAINWTYSTVLIQKLSPDEKLGRIFSIDWIGFNISMLTGTMLQGAFLDFFGVDQIIWVINGTLFITAIPVVIWFWAIWKLDQIQIKSAIGTAGATPPS